MELLQNLAYLADFRDQRMSVCMYPCSHTKIDIFSEWKMQHVENFTTKGISESWTCVFIDFYVTLFPEMAPGLNLLEWNTLSLYDPRGWNWT